jgi:hypothetical protein
LQLPADAVIASSKKLFLKVSESVMRDPHVADKFYPYKPYQSDYILLKSGEERSGLGLPTPPQELWMGYGPTTEDFLNSGKVDVDKMKKILGSVGFRMQHGNRVLDFGCASGRMIRWLIDFAVQCEIWGVDISAWIWYSSATSIIKSRARKYYGENVTCASPWTQLGYQRPRARLVWLVRQ